MSRLILHSDLNNFYASVECLHRPEYAKMPLIVAGDPKNRHGVVLAKNAIAKKAGVKTGDVLWEAKNKCPDAVIVPPRHDLYEDYSQRVFEVYTEFSPCVEHFGPDECWLDCTGCTLNYGDGVGLAKAILKRVYDRTGLTVSVGISFSKPLAKLCSDLAEPNSYFEANEQNFRERLWGLPVSDLIFVGPSTTQTLLKHGISTVGQLALCDDGSLKRWLGVNGLKIKAEAAGTDGEPVRYYYQSRKQESVGHGTTTKRDLVSPEELHLLLLYLCEKIASRLIKADRKGYGVHISLRTHDLKTSSKQCKLERAVFAAPDITSAALKLALELWGEERVPLRSVSVSVFDLCPMSEGVQLSFFPSPVDKHEALELAIHKIRAKHGRAAIGRAALLVDTEFICDKTDAEDFLPFKR